MNRPKSILIAVLVTLALLAVLVLGALFLASCTAAPVTPVLSASPDAVGTETAAVPIATPVPESTATPLPSPTPEPDPTTPAPASILPLLTMVEYDYRFRFPPEYQAGVYRNTICLSLEQGYGPPGLCHSQRFSIDVRDAEGRSLAEWANEVAAAEIERVPILIAGEPALLIDHVPAQDVLRIIVVLHAERVYILVFAGWEEPWPDDSPEGILYNTIMGSFEFLSSLNTDQ